MGSDLPGVMIRVHTRSSTFALKDKRPRRNALEKAALSSLLIHVLIHSSFIFYLPLGKDLRSLTILKHI